MFKASPALNLYASYGQGFQTPLGSELAYRPDGGAGPNFDAEPARSVNGESVQSCSSARSSTAEARYSRPSPRTRSWSTPTSAAARPIRTAGRTRRRGAEGALDWRLAEPWHLQLAYTYVEATYSDAYETCTSAPCSAPSVLVPAGNRLPGVPRTTPSRRCTTDARPARSSPSMRSC